MPQSTNAGTVVSPPPGQANLTLEGATVVAAATAAVVFCYADVLTALWAQWNTNEANSHGILIPWVAGYLLWLERRRFRLGASGLSPWAGLALLAASLVFLLGGRMGGIVGLQEVSLVGALWALSLVLFGRSGFRAAFFPIGYLLFMMPIWDLATEHLYLPLQLFAAGGAHSILSAFGVPAFRDGTILQLPEFSVEVAFACSGINFLMSVLAVGAALAYLSSQSSARRLVILTGTAIIALLANPVRIAVIVGTFYQGVSSPRQGHAWQGLLVSLSAFGLLFMLVRLVAEPNPDTGTRSQIVPAPPNGSLRSRPLFVGLVACGLLIGAGFARPLERTPPPLRNLLRGEVPTVLGRWHLSAFPAAGTSLGGLTDSGEFLGYYCDPTRRCLSLYVAPFARSAGRQLAYWSDQVVEVAKYAPRAHPSRISANSGFLESHGKHTRVIYWYQLGTFVSTNRAVAKLHSLATGLLNRSGPLVVVLCPDSRSWHSVDAPIEDFAVALRQELRRAW